MSLSNGPLRGDEQRLYAYRSVDGGLDRSVDRRENVLLGSTRGLGLTSALLRLEAEHGGTYVNASRAGDAFEILQSLAMKLGSRPSPVRNIGLAFAAADPLGVPSALADLQAVVDHRSTPSLFLVDGPMRSEHAHVLFGTWRDEVFGLGATWVVGAHSDRLAAYREPPAGVFFDQTMRCEPFLGNEPIVLLRKRGLDLPPERIAEIVELAEGSPRELVRLARRAIASPAVPLRPAGGPSDSERLEGLSAVADMLYRELIASGQPSHVTDERLIARLGTSESRLRRAMAELRGVGLVVTTEGRTEGPGRPPTFYEAVSPSGDGTGPVS